MLVSYRGSLRRSLSRSLQNTHSYTHHHKSKANHSHTHMRAKAQARHGARTQNTLNPFLSLSPASHLTAFSTAPFRWRAELLASRAAALSSALDEPGPSSSSSFTAKRRSYRATATPAATMVASPARTAPRLVSPSRRGETGVASQALTRDHRPRAFLESGLRGGRDCAWRERGTEREWGERASAGRERLQACCYLSP